MQSGALSMLNPDLVAANAVWMARDWYRVTPSWHATLEAYTTYTEDNMYLCRTMFLKVINSMASSELTAIYDKYSQAFHWEVALDCPFSFGVGGSGSTY